MQNRLSRFCLALLTLCSVHAAAQSTATDAQYAQGVVRVKLQPAIAQMVEKAQLPTSATSSVITAKAGAKYVTTGVRQLDAMASKVHAVSMKRVFPYAGKNEARHHQYGLDQWYDITFDNSEMTPLQVKNLYKSTVGIMCAQRVPVYTISDSQKYRRITPAQIARAQKASATMPFNDPMLAAQWHYHNDGSISGCKAGADINLFPAWASGVTGSSDVIVAIIDGGFQIDHPDLKDNVWVNEAELNGKPGVDDDGDGYVDDIYGWNFMVDSNDLSAHSHGTHVAGTVGATNGNGIGVCGVAGGSNGQGGVKMMVCQVFDTRASSSAVADFAAAIVYAADMGASIAQCSWGLSTSGETDDAITEAIDYFTEVGGGDKMNGGLCIFASGNTSDEGDYFPGCLDEVVGVGATTSTGAPAYYASRGSWVDVSAPGGLLDNSTELGVLSTLPGDTYGYNEGTSMACPHVSGIAALILSKYGNKNFSNETLRTLLTTSVNDIYSDYPEYAGLFGSGCIDAYKALQGSEGSVPSAVADYTLTPSHDNVLVEWLVPDNDEKMVDHHVIYYSTSEFDASADLSKLRSVSVDTKYKVSGDSVSYELSGLKANTTYYFTIVAYNRWGKASAASAVKTATTNEGPTATFDKTALSLSLNASKAATAEGSFGISNTGKGVLKYELTAATTKATYSTSDRNAKPTPGNVVAFSGKMQMASATTSASNTLVTSDYQAADWPSTLSYTNYVYAYFGETDTELPNAMAQYFKVDKSTYPNGFNLTALNISGSYGENPVIEIYDGTRSISTASLLTTVTYDYFTYGSDVNLPEQVYFAPGSSFWVVVKFAAGYTRPLAASVANTSGIENYSFYSSDNGQSWTQLTEVLKGTSYESMSSKLTWAITAKSKNPDWSQVLNPEPLKGEVRAGETQTVTVKNDGQKMVNGTYKFNLKVKTNEAQAADHKVQVNLTVTGNAPEMTSKQMIDFGTLLVGETKTMDIELTNKGYGVFGGKYGAGFYTYNKTLSCSSDQFDVSAGAPSVPARSSKTMTVKFKPTKAGTFSGTITLTDKNKNVYTYTVYGVANEPPHLTMEQSEFDLGDLNVDGTEKTQTFTLKNEGKYPLQYVFPKFSDKTIEGSTTAHKYGYSYETNLTGDSPAYEAAPELADETDITSHFSDQIWLSGAIDLGFKFPFYGDTYDKVYVTTHGGISMTSVSGSIGCFVPDASCVSGLGYISAFGNSGYPGSLFMRGGSKVSYGHKDGKFVVKFHDVATLGSNGDDVRVSFHMNLCPDGSVEIFYDNLEAQQLRENGTLMYIGVADKTSSDPFTITESDIARADEGALGYQITSGTAIKIVAPGTSMVKSLTSTDGYIGIGEQKDITVTVAAGDGFNAGALTNNLVVLTNDPDNASKNIVLKANIVGDGLVPVAALSTDSIDFGNVYRTSVQKRYINLANNGHDVLTVTSATLADGLFTVADGLKEGFTVAAGQSKDIAIVLPTDEEGAVSDKLVLAYADGTSATVALKGNVIGCPTADITPEDLFIDVPYGETVERTFIFDNNGNENLTVGIEDADWFKFNSVEADGEKSFVDYNYVSQVNGDDVDYNWIDITGDYDGHLCAADFVDITDFGEVELPFEFPFYGKNYSTMYVYDTGFVQFDEPEVDYHQFPEPPASLPTSETFYTNIICPFWGNHSMNTATEDGVYYKVYDDHAVVSFINYGNTMMYGMNFQVILNSDGTFKFQYKLDYDGFMSQPFGLCGIMNHGGTRGVQPSSANIASGNAVMFRPAMSYVVAPGESLAVPVTIAADQLAGTYEHTLNVTTNDPAKESVQIPVTLNITGEALPVMPDSVCLEQVVDENCYMAEVEFEISNGGKRAFTISNIAGELIDMDDWGSSMGQIQVLTDGASGGGDDPGPLSLADDSNKSWSAWYPGYSSPITVGLEPVKFKFVFFQPYQTCDIKSALTFTIDEVGDKSVPVYVKITDAPHMTFDRDEIVVSNASDDFTTQETVNIGNDGNYTLQYSLKLDPSGRDAAVEESGSGGGISPLMDASFWKRAAAVKKVQADSLMQIHSLAVGNEGMTLLRKAAKRVTDTQKFVYDVPTGISYTNLLYYPVFNPVTSAAAVLMGTGSSDLDQNFYAATRFVAPAEGFNLSKLFFVGTVGTLENVDIEATVVLGSKVNAKNANIGHGKLHIDSEEKAYAQTGKPRTLSFDKPVYVNPNDTFYVVLKYPAGYKSSALMASKDGDTSADRYMCYLKSLGGWVDLEALYDEAYSYGAFGYFMTCIEEEKGEPWIKLLNAETEGQIAVGEQLPVNLAINAKSAYYAKQNKATLVVTSNDPTQKTVNYHIWLDKNGAPDVTAPSGTTSAPQGDTTTVALTVADADGDAFTVSVADNDGFAILGACTNADGTTDGITVENGIVSVAAGTVLKANVLLTPTYGCQTGAKAFYVEAEDANGNRKETSVNYYVEFTNRAPEYTGDKEMAVYRGETTPVNYYTNLFSDPDGDAMTYSVSVRDSRYVDIYESENGFVLCGKANGTTVLTITATDANGAVTTQTVTVTVSTSTGIDGVVAADKGVSAEYAGGTLGVTLAEGAQLVSLHVYTAGGAVVAETVSHNVAAGSVVKLPLGNVPAGIYQLVADVDGTATSVKFVVK